jgi:hypothetical protein
MGLVGKSALLAFPVAFVVLATVAGAWFLCQRRHKDDDGGSLKYLESAWSFKESWASNVTVAVGLVAGIFGSSEVVTALGSDWKSAAALVIVGGAVSAAFVSAGPLVLLALKKGDYLTVFGLIAASVVTLTGGFGEICVLWEAAQRFRPFSQWPTVTGLMAVAVVLLLGVYAVRSLSDVIRNGLTAPKAAPPSDTLTAATMIVKAIQAFASADKAASFETMLDKASSPSPPTPEARRHRRRTALL